MRNWLKPEHFITAIIALVGWFGIWSVSHDAAVQRDTLSGITMAQLDKRLANIEASTSGMSTYVLRLTQLETWHDRQEAYNGSMDQRMNSLTNKTDVMQSQFDDMRRASGIKLKGDPR